MTRTTSLAILLGLGGLLPVWGQKYADPDSPLTERAAREALPRAKVLEIAGMSRDISGLLRELGGRTTDLGIQVDLPSDVLFDFDKSDIRPSAAGTLAKVAELIRAYPNAPVQIDGHTDGAGSADYNFRLSDRRASSVKDSLVRNGTAPARLATKGWGATRPVAPNRKQNGADDPEGRQKNRRVEITIQTKTH